MIRERPRILRDWVDPEPRSRPALRPLAAIVLTAGVLFLGLQAWWILTPAPGVKSGPRIVEIPAHRGFLEVARQLDAAGVIRSPLGFMLLTIARGSMRSLKAGEYQIPQGANTLTVLALIEGGQVLQHNVVFARARRWRSSPASSRTSGSPRADDILRSRGRPSSERSRSRRTVSRAISSPIPIHSSRA
jgi:cell division protein YceG involved in septum cleavage